MASFVGSKAFFKIVDTVWVVFIWYAMDAVEIVALEAAFCGAKRNNGHGSAVRRSSR